MEKAPIVIFVYNRLVHTKKVVEALKQNPESKYSTLYIYSDAPKKEEDKEPVKEVRDYIKKVEGFKEVKVIERGANFGLSKSIISGVTNTVEKHGRVIVLEDDLVVSQYFLRYMNEALEMYKDDKKVGAVSGFLLPLKRQVPQIFLHYFNCWGWATWKDRWDLFERDGKKLLKEIKHKELTNLFNINNTYPFTRILRNQTRGFSDSWSIRWYATLFLNDMLTLYPGKSLVRNIGFDNTGTHGQKRDIFETSLTDSYIELKKIETKQNKEAYKALQKYFKGIFWERLFGKIKRLIKNPIKELRNL